MTQKGIAKHTAGINSQNFFKELGKTTKCKETTSSVIDDIHGSSNIASHFKTIYESLFNEQNSDDLDDIEAEINEGINNSGEDSMNFINDTNKKQKLQFQNNVCTMLSQ